MRSSLETLSPASESTITTDQIDNARKRMAKRNPEAASMQR